MGALGSTCGLASTRGEARPPQIGDARRDGASCSGVGSPGTDAAKCRHRLAGQIIGGKSAIYRRTFANLPPMTRPDRGRRPPTRSPLAGSATMAQYHAPSDMPAEPSPETSAEHNAAY